MRQILIAFLYLDFLMSNRDKLDRAQTYEKFIKVELCNGNTCKWLVAN